MHTDDAHDSSSDRNVTGLPNAWSLADFLEITFDAVVAFDAQERITSWNPAAEQLYGWTVREALGKTPAKLFWPVNTPEEKKDRRQRQSRLKRGETLRGEHEACRKDSSYLRVQYAARAVFDAEGNVTGYLAVYRDLSGQNRDTTDSKQKDESLRARTEEIETLLVVSPVAIFVAHDPECTHITGNPAGYRMVELPEEANISKSAPNHERPTYRTFRNGVEVPTPDLPMQKAARLGVEVREDELELRFEDGSQKFLYAFAKPLFDSQGKSRGAVAAMLDITERKHAEEQLEQSNQKLNEILASILDDFYVIDRDWIFIYANRQFASKLGKEPEDFVGNNVWEMFPKHVGTVLEENFRAAMEKRETRRFETPGKYTDAWYKITVFPSPEGITVLGSEITEHRRLQAETESMAKFPQENPNPVLRLSQEGVVLFGNRASQKLLDHWNCSIGTPVPAMWREKVTEQFRLGVSGEAMLECNGRIFLLQLVPILENHYLNIYGRDITERRRAEEALRENQKQLQLLNETLEQQVHEKTAEVRHLASEMIKAVQRERHRLSHILHDDLQQRVYAIRMQLTFLRDHLPRENEPVQKDMTDMETQLDEILMVTRNLSIDLSPPILRDEGLSQAINWLAARMRQRYGLPIKLQANGAFALTDEELHVLLFNCVRELLFNVVKHAEASQAVVVLRWAGADLQIEVRDDGKGFPSNPPAQQVNGELSEDPDLQAGSGLPTIRHQLGLFDGRMEIQSEPGAGSRILLTVPILEAGI